MQRIYDITLDDNKKVTLAEECFEAKFPKPASRQFDRLLQLREFFPEAAYWERLEIDEMGNAKTVEAMGW